MTSYEYDPLDRQTKQTLPYIGGSDSRDTVTEYNRVGEVIKVTDPKGQIVETDYDRAGRVTDVRLKSNASTTEESRHSSYDKNGNQISIATDTGGSNRASVNGIGGISAS